MSKKPGPQSMPYVKNMQLLSINNSTLTSDGGVMKGEGNDVFGMQLLYDQTDSNVGEAIHVSPKHKKVPLE